MGIALVLLLLLVCIPLLIFYFRSNQKISVVNKSSLYTVRYKPTQQFLSDLDKWGVWTNDNAFLETTGGRHTIKKIVILTIDSVQPYYSLEDKANGEVIQSVDESINNDGTYSLKVYVNQKTISKLTVQEMEQTFLFIVVSRLFQVSHSTQSADLQFNEVAKIIAYYKSNADQMPFEITKK